MSADENAIREVIARWMDATKNHDAETILGLMTEDVLFLIHGQPPFGKAEFAQSLAGQKGMTIAGESDIQEIQIFGDYAYVRSNLTVEVTLPDGKQLHRAGPSLSIFYRGMDLEWRLTRDANLLATVPAD